MSSVEFSEWLAFWHIEAEMTGLVKRDPTPDELGGRFAAAFAMHNAKEVAR